MSKAVSTFFQFIVRQSKRFRKIIFSGSIEEPDISIYVISMIHQLWKWQFAMVQLYDNFLSYNKSRNSCNNVIYYIFKIKITLTSQDLITLIVQVFLLSIMLSYQLLLLLSSFNKSSMCLYISYYDSIYISILSSNLYNKSLIHVTVINNSGLTASFFMCHFTNFMLAGHR